MSSRYQCFMIEHAGQTKRSLRRYVRWDSRSPEQALCSGEGNQGYHQSFVELDVVVQVYGILPGYDFECWHEPDAPDVPHDDPRWQNVCACGYQFAEDDEWQIFTDSLYKRSDNGELVSLRNAPAGAMWWAIWMPKNMYWDNKEDDNLMVKLPDGTDWCVDSRCNNCTEPQDRTHRCWGRTGTPPVVTAGKIGPTCKAGGGSIKAPRYHGFLQDGFLNATGDSET